MRKIIAGLFTSLDGVVESPEWGVRRDGRPAERHSQGRRVQHPDSADWQNSTLIRGLFREPGSQPPLTLTGSEAFSTGVVHLSYEPAN